MKNRSASRWAALLGLISVLALGFHSAQAGSATWNLNPANDDWNSAANWTPATVPNGPSDVATFAMSNQKSVSLSAAVAVDSIVFSPGTSGFTISAFPEEALTISGTGVVNHSGATQHFIADREDNSFGPGGITFRNNATAGSNTAYTVVAPIDPVFGNGGDLTFSDNSSADHATIDVFGLDENEGADAVILNFFDSSTAGNATIILHENSLLRVTGLQSAPTLGSAVVTNTMATIQMSHGANAGQATITNAGQPKFFLPAWTSWGATPRRPPPRTRRSLMKARSGALKTVPLFSRQDQLRPMR